MHRILKESSYIETQLSKYIQKEHMGGGIMQFAPLLIHRVAGFGGGSKNRNSEVVASVTRILRYPLPNSVI